MGQNRHLFTRVLADDEKEMPAASLSHRGVCTVLVLADMQVYFVAVSPRTFHWLPWKLHTEILFHKYRKLLHFFRLYIPDIRYTERINISKLPRIDSESPLPCQIMELIE